MSMSRRALDRSFPQGRGRTLASEEASPPETTPLKGAATHFSMRTVRHAQSMRDLSPRAPADGCAARCIEADAQHPIAPPGKSHPHEVPRSGRVRRGGCGQRCRASLRRGSGRQPHLGTQHEGPYHRSKQTQVSVLISRTVHWARQQAKDIPDRVVEPSDITWLRLG